MIQELLIKGDDQKPNLTTSSPPSSSPPSSGESIRCPRCDSSNTKFCYYNNYNLTQPRHFCKTCRRYWTKGGALRNVPIGGGCRKNKTSSSSSAVGPAAAGKLKTLTSEMARTGSLFTGFETPNFHHHHSLSANPNLVWAPPHNNNNHFLSLLRSNHVINQHPNSHARVSGLDPNLGLGHGPSPIYRNQSSMGLGLAHGGEAQYSGMQDLYHRLRSAPGCYNLQPAENAPMIGNITSANYSSLANAAILESAPVGTAGELGFWNSNNNNNISLPAHHDVPAAANGTRAYPD